MQAIDLTKPGEKKKLISAAALGFVALIVLYWVFFGFGGSTNTNTPRASATPTPARNQRPGTQTQQTAQTTQTVSPDVAAAVMWAPVLYQPSSYNAPEAARNIFAYYVPPPKPVKVVQEPTPTPIPPPPLLLASMSPSNVYARSADFKLEIAGDKFTPATKIYFEGQELKTNYVSPQQLSANVAASMIAAPGQRNIVVRTADNSLYTNAAILNVAAPPVPNFTYVGIISPNNRVEDVAIVQDKSKKDIMNVHRGDVLGGRFRVTSISDKELVMMDTTLRIQHKLTMTEGEKNFNNPLTRPTPQVESEDDEP
ncbi:MAG TPA: IPT/TIG domain-containing protein [Pyrinomonadaceae bacterium]|nr:IPT/TIG domain-containing protein [Pyrinomonadaceae bacterium]